MFLLSTSTIANHHQTTLWENIFTFSKHLMQIQVLVSPRKLWTPLVNLAWITPSSALFPGWSSKCYFFFVFAGPPSRPNWMKLRGLGTYVQKTWNTKLAETLKPSWKPYASTFLWVPQNECVLKWKVGKNDSDSDGIRSSLKSGCKLLWWWFSGFF